MLNFVEKIKDPIWGWIPITPLEQEIINSSAFTRIRHIKQMSMAYVTYVGANHTRYEHSIGTMHVAYRIGMAIPKIREFFGDKFDVAIQSLRLSALLHDVGHPPFSHAVEWTFKKNPSLSPIPNYSHDEYSRKIIKEDKELDEIINEYLDWINKEQHYHGHDFQIDKNDFKKTIAALAVGDKETLLKQQNEFLQSLVMLAPILNGDLDADKIDYILRDNYHSGFPTGVDFNEITEAFDLYRGEKSTEDKLLLKRTHISAVETLLHSRLKLIDLIHYETKTRIANHMLMKSVAKIIRELDKSQRSEIVHNMHTKWTDYEMFNFVLSRSKEDSMGVRLFRGEVLPNSLKFGLLTLPPITRRNLYLISKNPESLLTVQKKLEEAMGVDVHLDICFISPPPLTLQLSEGTQGRRPYLYDASKVIEGILLESFSRSFVAIYTDASIEESSEMRDILIREVDNIGNELRDEIWKKQKIACGELIICVLVAVEKFAHENLERFSLWVYSIGRLQQFISSLIKESNYQLSDFRIIEQRYDPRFYREVKQLVFSGLIDEREKEITYDLPPIYYNRRLDYKINSFGAKYYEKYLSSSYEDITNLVLKRLIKVREPIKRCIESDINADKIEDYKKFLREIKTHTKDIEQGGGCVLVT